MFLDIQKRAICALAFSLLLPVSAFGQSTDRVSVDSNGAQANNTSWSAAVSTEGRHVVFYSYASNLVTGDTNGMTDIFLKDTVTGVTERIDVDVNGVQSDHNSWWPDITPDGRYVAYSSGATNLVAGDTNWVIDVYRYDRQTGITDMASVDSHGVGGDNHSFYPTISDDGQRIAFMSKATNLVAGDTNGKQDIFMHDFVSGSTIRASVDSTGFEANDDSNYPSISGNGYHIAYHSCASNLVRGDTNGAIDCFVYDAFGAGLTERVSTGGDDQQGNYHSSNPVISWDGRYVAFESGAHNWIPGDSVNTDIFVKDRWSSAISRVNISSTGTLGVEAFNCDMSADGRYVTFWSNSTFLIPNDTNNKEDVFVHDRDTGVTERVSVRSNGVEVPWAYCVYPAISPDGRCVAFRSDGYIVIDDTNNFDDIFLHDRWSGEGINSIYLTAPSSATVGSTIDLSWQCTRGGSNYWVAYSLNQGGQLFGGHIFDLGLPSYILASGTHTLNGLGNYTTAPVPQAALGQTLHFEIAAQDAAGVLYDSNARSVVIN